MRGNQLHSKWEIWFCHHTTYLLCEAVHITTTAEDRVTLSWSNGNSSWEPGYYTHKNIRYLSFRIRYNYFNLNAKIASVFLIWESLIDSKDLYPTKSRIRILECHLKFIFSEKATKFCEVSTLLLSYVVPVKSKVEISQNFVAFLEQYSSFSGWCIGTPGNIKFYSGCCCHILNSYLENISTHCEAVSCKVSTYDFQ